MNNQENPRRSSRLATRMRLADLAPDLPACVGAKTDGHARLPKQSAKRVKSALSYDEDQVGACDFDMVTIRDGCHPGGGQSLPCAVSIVLAGPHPTKLFVVDSDGPVNWCVCPVKKIAGQLA